MMELSQRRTASRVAFSSGSQESRLVIALVILLVTLGAVLIKDRQFWFGSESTISDANEPQQAAVPAAPAPETAVKPETPAPTSAPVHVAKKQAPAVATPAQPKPAEAPAVVTNRTALPPLNVEVVAGDKHQNVHPGSNALKVQVAKPTAPASHQAVAAPAVNAAQRERLAEAVPPAYPPLAQHMNVQGSVVLQALINADGTVQSLRKLSGPEILASAAQQAVREWRFKPVYQNGAAVETRATITVNFTIKVADSSPNTTLASNDDVTITNQ